MPHVYQTSVSRVIASVVLLGALFTGKSACAQIYAFDTNASYEAASFSIVDSITFNGLPATQSSFTDYGNPGNLVAGGVTFTTNSGTSLFAVGPHDIGAGGTTYNFDGSSTLVAQGSMQANGPGAISSGLVVVDAALPVSMPPVTAVGTDIGSSFIGAALSATVTLKDGTVESFSLPAESAGAITAGLDFWGFVSAGSPIVSVSFTDSTADALGTPTLTIDDFTYGVVNTAGLVGLGGGDPLPTPEPSTYALIGMGAFALYFFRRRQAMML